MSRRLQYSNSLSAVDAVSDMKMMQDRLREALQADGKDAEAIKARLKRFKFARDPMSGSTFLCMAP